jgi:DNA polymerase III alpha subunit
MKTDHLGIPIYSKDDLLDIIYQGNTSLLEQIIVDIDQTEFEKFNSASKDQFGFQLRQYSPVSITQEQFDLALQSDWLMPNDYKTFDIEQWIIDQTPPWAPEATRVEEELAAYRARDMINLLRWLKYFVDTCRAKGIVWGVGRGSSVASYVLYLIGVHKIDSIKYNLDWQEFLR